MKRFSMLTVSMAIVLGMFISPGYSDTVTLYPVVDTYVSTYAPDSTTGSTSTILEAGSTSAGTNIWRTFLKFDLSAIPSNSVITSANLTLYGSSGYNVNYSLYHVPSDTAVTNATTWNTQPSAGVFLYDMSYGPGGGLKTWNLLAISNAWNSSSDLQDGYVSLLIRYAGTEPTAYTLAQFYSMDIASSDENHPHLVIQYQAVPIPAALWLLGSGLIGLVAIRRRMKK